MMIDSNYRRLGVKYPPSLSALATRLAASVGGIPATGMVPTKGTVIVPSVPTYTLVFG